MTTARITYTIDQRIDMLRFYFENGSSATAALRKFKAKYGIHITLNQRSLQNCVDKFLKTRSVLDEKAPNFGHPITVSTPKTIQKVKDIFTEKPTTSLRDAAGELGVSKSTVRKIVKKDLELFPYKIQVHQLLKPFDIERKLDFANQMLEMIRLKQIDPKKIWFSDEAHCDLYGYVNKQKYRHWGTQKPEFVVSCHLHSQRLTVWCAISHSGIIGPFFLTQSITGAVYREEILEKFIPEVKRRKGVRNFWFQQDGEIFNAGLLLHNVVS